MNDFVNDLEVRYAFPSRAEVERQIARAHELRNEAMRDALAGLWGFVRRSIGIRPVAHTA